MSDVSTAIRVKDGEILVRRSQDCEPILDRNKALQNQGSQSKDFRHMATIPAVILERWIVEDQISYLTLPKEEFSRLIRRKLRDPDWKWLRTGTGRI